MKYEGAYSVTLAFAVLCTLVAGQTADDNHLEYDLIEESDIGTFVGDVMKDARVAELIDDPISVSQVQFKFLGDEPMTIGEKDGVIRTKERIDRDAICPGEPTCHLEMSVAILPSPVFRIVKVKINILDINDNAPIFQPAILTLRILESTAPGRSFNIRSAEDADSPLFGIDHYELTPTNQDLFDLQVTDKPGGSKQVKVVLKKALNRESMDYYQVKITAYDKGSPAQLGTLEVTVIVEDSNDNNPVFDKDTYEVTISENMEKFKSILQVHATDADIGSNGKIQYGFSPETMESQGHLFSINSSTGQVSLKANVNYEKETVHQLTVTAIDLGADAVPTEALVVVTIEDVNDHSPEITVNSLSAHGTDVVEMLEDAALGTFVVHILVVDKDSGSNGDINCTLSEKDFQLQQLYPGAKEYKIITAAELDRETREEYNLAIVCRDGGVNSLVSVKHIRLLVRDVNDQTPKFTKQDYNATIKENNRVNQYITKVSATDGDTGHNAEIQYTIKNINHDLLHIDSRTGIITAKAVFDHEHMPVLRFQVIASDKGVPAKYDTSYVTVTIEDQNDEPPKFTEPAFSFGVYENEPPHSEVGSVMASDADGPPYNQFTFKLIGDFRHTSKFEINPRSGMITTRESLDREDCSTHHLIAVATDGGLNPMSSSASVTIYVADVNDNLPTFYFPSRTNNTVHISNMVPVGHNITQVYANDSDAGTNAQVTYKFGASSYVHDNLFAIDSVTGLISVGEDLSAIDHATYELTIIAEDHGSPRVPAFANMNIVVNKSIAYLGSSGAGQILNGPNFIIVVTLGCVMGVVMVILIIAIVFICRRDARKQHGRRYNCPKAEALKMLQTKDAVKVKDATQTPVSRDDKLNTGFTCENSTKKNGNQRDGSFQGQGDVSSRTDKSGHSYTSTIDHRALEHPQAHSSVLTSQTSQTLSPPIHGGRDGAYAPYHPNPYNNRWNMSQKELEVHQLLNMLKRDTDSDSEKGSNTDSGRGPSEEGDHQGKGKTISPDTQVVPSLSTSRSYNQGFTEKQQKPLPTAAPISHHHSLQRQASDSHLGSFRPKNGNGANNYKRVDNSSFGSSTNNPNSTQSTIVDCTFISETEPSVLDGTYTGLLNAGKKSHSANSSPLKKKQPPAPPPRGESISSFRAQLPMNKSSYQTPADRRPLPNKHTRRISPGSACTIDMTDNNGLQYTVADMSDLLRTNPSLQGSPNQQYQDTADDASSTTSGSYVVDPQELCDEIDNLFFKDVMV